MGRYWDNAGKYQDTYNRLSGELVPAEGHASTVAGEMLRAMSNVYYDYYNNGACNLDGGRQNDAYLLMAYSDWVHERVDGYTERVIDALYRSVAGGNATSEELELAVDLVILAVEKATHAEPADLWPASRRLEAVTLIVNQM